MAMWKIVCPNCREVIMRTEDPGNLPLGSRCLYCKHAFTTKDGLMIIGEKDEAPRKIVCFGETPSMKAPARAEWDER